MMDDMIRGLNDSQAGVFCITPRKGIFQESDGQVGLADPFMRPLVLPRLRAARPGRCTF